jgi:poly(A) polymerase
MTGNVGDWIRAPAPTAVMAALASGGHRAYVVGGAVRNALLGEAPGDIDIATDALPQRVMELAVAAGLRAVPTGLAHGTVTVVADHQGIEVTTFRRDVETDGRRAVVAFSDQLEEDAARRDFTMNALYADAAGQVIDPLGGLADLAARRVRFVGDPSARIREDYLRILRFFRFHAWYGRDGPEPEGLAACAALAEGIDSLSRERVTAEMLKLFSAPDPAPAVAAMAAAGVLWRVLPGSDHRALAPLVHLEDAEALGPDPLVRLAALGGDTGRLRLSRADARRHEMLREAAASGAAAAELGWRHGARDALCALVLRLASAGAPLAPDAAEEAARGAAAKFPVQAADLAPLEGPALGERLRALQSRWLASGLTLDREALLREPQPPASSGG